MHNVVLFIALWLWNHIMYIKSNIARLLAKRIHLLFDINNTSYKTAEQININLVTTYCMNFLITTELL